MSNRSDSENEINRKKYKKEKKESHSKHSYQSSLRSDKRHRSSSHSSRRSRSSRSYHERRDAYNSEEDRRYSSQSYRRDRHGSRRDRSNSRERSRSRRERSQKERSRSDRDRSRSDNRGNRSDSRDRRIDESRASRSPSLSTPTITHHQQQQQHLAMTLAACGGIGGPSTPTTPAALASIYTSTLGINSLSLPYSIITALEPKELRELFIGNLPPQTTELVLQEFLNAAMRYVGYATGPEGMDPVIATRMNNKYAFIECRTADDATKLMSLNNIPFMGCFLKIGRPSKYNGPPTYALTWQQLIASTTSQNDSSHASQSLCQTATLTSVDPTTKVYRELFVGNTSPEMTENGIQEFLGGALERMGLTTGPGNPIIQCRTSPRFAFIELRTVEETANCMNLTGIPYMGQPLKLSRPSKYAGPSIAFYEWDDLLSRWMTGELKIQTAGPPSPVIRLTNMCSEGELRDSTAQEEVISDTREECTQYGTVELITLHAGHVFVRMSSEDAAKAALVALKGRTFDGRVVDVKFFPLEKFIVGDLSDPPSVVVTSNGVTTVAAVVGTVPRPTAAQLSVGGASALGQSSLQSSFTFT